MKKMVMNGNGKALLLLAQSVAVLSILVYLEFVEVVWIRFALDKL